MRPIVHLSHQTVLYRIEISIKNMMLQIRIITDFMLPKPPLPNTRFTLFYFGLHSDGGSYQAGVWKN